MLAALDLPLVESPLCELEHPVLEPVPHQMLELSDEATAAIERAGGDMALLRTLLLAARGERPDFAQESGAE